MPILHLTHCILHLKKACYRHSGEHLFNRCPTVYRTFSASVKQKMCLSKNNEAALLPLYPIQGEGGFDLAVEKTQKHHHIFLTGK